MNSKVNKNVLALFIACQVAAATKCRADIISEQCITSANLEHDVLLFGGTVRSTMASPGSMTDVTTVISVDNTFYTTLKNVPKEINDSYTTRQQGSFGSVYMKPMSVYQKGIWIIKVDKDVTTVLSRYLDDLDEPYKWRCEQASLIEKIFKLNQSERYEFCQKTLFTQNPLCCLSALYYIYINDKSASKVHSIAQAGFDGVHPSAILHLNELIIQGGNNQWLNTRQQHELLIKIDISKYHCSVQEYIIRKIRAACLRKPLFIDPDMGLKMQYKCILHKEQNEQVRIAGINAYADIVPYTNKFTDESFAILLGFLSDTEPEKIQTASAASLKAIYQYRSPRIIITDGQRDKLVRVRVSTKNTEVIKHINAILSAK